VKWEFDSFVQQYKLKDVSRNSLPIVLQIIPLCDCWCYPLLLPGICSASFSISFVFLDKSIKPVTLLKNYLSS